MKIEEPTSGSSPSQKTRVSVKRGCSACIYYRKPYSEQKTWKRMKKSWFSHEIPPQASPKTLSVMREYYFRHFWWKIFSSFFQLIFWTIFFAQFRWNFHDILKHSWHLFTTTSDKTYENHWIFWWNHSKNMIQNMSWKNDENIFHQKCRK